MSVEGTFVDARQNGGVARLVFSSAPRAIETPALAARAAGWVPMQRFHSLITGHRYSRQIASCSDVQRPAQFSGSGMLSILTVEPRSRPVCDRSTALMADAQVVYGSSSSLYVATQGWINPFTPAAEVPSSPETVIDKFDASGGEHTPLVASGASAGVPAEPVLAVGIRRLSQGCEHQPADLVELLHASAEPELRDGAGGEGREP